MTEMVCCGGCGARFSARHERCPRCKSGDRSPFATEEKREGQRRGPGSRTAGGLVLLLLLLTASWMWALQGGGAASASATVPGPLAAIARGKQPRRLPAAKVPAVMPFIDADAIGRVAYVQGDYEAALARFREEIGRRPSDAEARNNAAQMLVRVGRPAEALPLLEKAVALDPERWAYRFNLARAHGVLGNWGQAAAGYQEAAARFPNDYATLFNLGQALHRAGREAEAVERYRQAIAANPDDATFHLALAISEEKMGRRAEAVDAFRRFLAMAPGAQEAPGVKARIERLTAAAAAEPSATPVVAPPT